MTELELLRKAKIPSPETGITVKRTLCDICTPGFHCGIDAYVRDGEVIKIEGTKEHPTNHGLLCTKGASNRQYIYRKDRLRTPLKRVGERGEGKFKEITWDEAYTEIAARMNATKETFGADSVAFFTGYGKWYRPFLHRLAYSFGSINYGSECSTCFTAGLIAWKASAGTLARPDTPNAKTYLGWAYNPFYSSYLAAGGLEALKANGAKIIVVDPRTTPTTERYADLHLRIRPGTDGALALGMANIIIQNGWQDDEYIRNYTYGYEEYAEYVKQFDLERVSRITGLDPKDIYTAAKWYATEGPSVCHEAPSTLVHNKNGFQNYRAIICLSALTGNFDRKGGSIPMDFSYIEQTAGFHTLDEEFYREKKPANHRPPIGSEQFPLWNAMTEEYQSMALAKQIVLEKPYPIKSLISFGMNTRMFPNTDKLRYALTKLDFFVNVDLFMTEACQYADIVLPACSSFERSEYKTYMGGYAVYTKPVIQPLYSSKPDSDIICDLAKYLELDDPLLRAGYREWIKYIISPLSMSLEELEVSELPLRMSEAKPFVPGCYTKAGFRTPTGKFEFKSKLVEPYQESHGLSPIPTYPLDEHTEENRFPYTLVTGARLPNMLHSRLHKVPWLRSMRPEPAADISLEDAEALQIKENDLIELYNDSGAIIVRAKPSHKIAKGQVFMYHGYEEANVSQLVSDETLDPYSGYASYKDSRCGIRRVKEAMR